MCGESGYAHFIVLTSYVLSKAGKSARQACVFSPTSADRLSEPHGSARAPFPVKRRKRETDNSLSNDKIQNRATTNKLYRLGLKQTYLFRRLCKIVKSDYQRVISVCLPVRPSLCQHGTTRLALNGFSRYFYLSIVRKSVEKILDFLNFDENGGYFT